MDEYTRKVEVIWPDIYEVYWPPTKQEAIIWMRALRETTGMPVRIVVVHAKEVSE